MGAVAAGEAVAVAEVIDAPLSLTNSHECEGANGTAQSCHDSQAMPSWSRSSHGP